MFEHNSITYITIIVFVAMATTFCKYIARGEIYIAQLMVLSIYEAYTGEVKWCYCSGIQTHHELETLRLPEP